ncbi:MAG: hypothetical protein WC568_05615, partial [Candidatus Methanoperedens sp.]
LGKLGVVLLDYTQDNAFYAKIPQDAFEFLSTLIAEKKIRYIGTIPSEAKIKPEFLKEAQKNPDELYQIVVYLLEEPTESNLKNLKEYMQIHSYSDVTYLVYGDAKGSKLSKIYDFTFIKLIEPETPLELFTNNITDSGNNTYIVIFREWTPNNREQVLSVKGVTYVTDTTFGNQGYPAIIISSNQSTANKIKEYNFIDDVQSVVMAQDVMPKAEEKTRELNELPIISLIVIILFCYRIRHRRGL